MVASALPDGSRLTVNGVVFVKTAIFTWKAQGDAAPDTVSATDETIRKLAVLGTLEGPEGRSDE